MAGDGIRNRRIGRRQAPRRGVGTELVDALCHRLESRRVRRREDRECALHHVAGVLPLDANTAGLRPAEVAVAGQPLSVEHEHAPAIGRVEDRCRIPADRNPARDTARTRLPDVDHRDIVVVGVGDQHRAAVRATAPGCSASFRLANPGRARPKSARPRRARPGRSPTRRWCWHTRRRAACRPSRAASSWGGRRRRTSPSGASVSAANIRTFAPPQSETNSVLPSRESTHVYGSASSVTL